MSTVTAVPLRPVKRGYVVWLWVGVAAALLAAFFLARQGEAQLLRESRGWTDEAWAAATERLTRRGLLDDAGGLSDDGVALRAEVERLRRDCAEAYQVIGALAPRAGLLQYPAVEKALENLDAATRGDPRPHADLLPIFLPDNENH